MNSHDYENFKKALDFARKRHEGQLRHYTGEPYIGHCLAVVDRLKDWGFSDRGTMLSAAILHDVVEDTKTTLTEIRELFGDTIAELVFWLTDYHKPKDGDRDTRALMAAWRISKAPQYAQIIKLADIMDNTTEIMRYDPTFGIIYIKEKRRLLEIMELSAIAPLDLVNLVKQSLKA